ncbi:MAG: membrane protein insertion efficiency factor YidD [Candidatus Cloacimonetes bacterium]|nr:membrane protein insertion efficiency factor YidD [Candidatus Cloacimonadota bacterium]MDD4155613.1 membrane protein insertion efficiency factor YidD [Candidatus Cloacimonadota bacterium]
MSLPNKISITLIIFYQKTISPFLPPSCRFTPTCSKYALQAFTKYSFLKALFLSIKRILKCHPFHPGGYDPLP